MDASQHVYNTPGKCTQKKWPKKLHPEDMFKAKTVHGMKFIRKRCDKHPRNGMSAYGMTFTLLSTCNSMVCCGFGINSTNNADIIVQSVAEYNLLHSSCYINSKYHSKLCYHV